jgi:hypothetical protein
MTPVLLLFLLMFQSAISPGRGTSAFGGGSDCTGACFDDWTGSAGVPIARPPWADMDGSFPASGFLLDGSGGMYINGFLIPTAYYTLSTSPISRAVIKAYSDAAVQKRLCVESSTVQGYCVWFGSASGGNWTHLEFARNGTSGTAFTGTWSQAADHTVCLSFNRTSHDLNVYVDGVVATGTFNDSSPLAAGHPGILGVGNGDNPAQGYGRWQDYGPGTAGACI